MIRLFIAVLLALSPLSASAFTEDTHQDVAEQAARLMPASLRAILAKNLDSLRDGARAPIPVPEDGLYLYPDGSYGTLDRTVEAQTRRVADLLAARAPMSQVARELGVLSHAIALASDPVHVTAHDVRTRDWAPGFARFVKDRTPRFHVAFGGYASPSLSAGDVRGLVRASAELSRRNAPLLVEMFLLPDGSVASIGGFDDRHPVFGIAALGYSHAITDTARLWLYVWIKAGGDTAGLPFPQALPPMAGMP